MNDGKNVFLAAWCSVSSFLTVAETQTWLTIVSAVVLPCIFFGIGKFVDVMVQIHFKRKEAKKTDDN